MSTASQLGTQALAIVVTLVWSALATWIIIKVLDALCGCRAVNDAEREGLDLTAHGERAYDLK
jgi:ammonium transporter, Amt family